MSRKRIKIHLTLDKSTYKKFEYISSQLYITKGLIIDELIEYVLKKELKCEYKLRDRYKITTTVNPNSWINFKKYADNNKLKYNQLIELAMSKRYSHYTRKIKLIKSTKK
jgi:hypothetical protein